MTDLPLLWKSIDWARSEHEKDLRGEHSEWNQSTWWQSTACGTACCIAGYIVKSIEDVQPRQVTPDLWVAEQTEGGESISACAQRHLGITEIEAIRLFRSGNDIEDLERIAARIEARRS